MKFIITIQSLLIRKGIFLFSIAWIGVLASNLFEERAFAFKQMDGEIHYSPVIAEHYGDIDYLMFQKLSNNTSLLNQIDEFTKRFNLQLITLFIVYSIFDSGEHCSEELSYELVTKKVLEKIDDVQGARIQMSSHGPAEQGFFQESPQDRITHALYGILDERLYFSYSAFEFLNQIFSNQKFLEFYKQLLPIISPKSPKLPALRFELLGGDDPDVFRYGIYVREFRERGLRLRRTEALSHPVLHDVFGQFHFFLSPQTSALSRFGNRLSLHSRSSIHSGWELFTLKEGESHPLFDLRDQYHFPLATGPSGTVDFYLTLGLYLGLGSGDMLLLWFTVLIAQLNHGDHTVIENVIPTWSFHHPAFSGRILFQKIGKQELLDMATYKPVWEPANKTARNFN